MNDYTLEMTKESDDTSLFQDKPPIEEKPLAQIGEFACLEIVAVEEVGAFLNWGHPKDLFLPYREQISELSVGEYAIVYIYEDSSSRPCASMRINKFLDKSPSSYQPGEEVDLMISAKTDLGYNAIINGKHRGVLYNNEIFHKPFYGETLKGYIKKVREDGKIDLLLQPAGFKAEVVGQIEEKILEQLKSNEGFLAINDKTEAEKIYQLFGVSKKKFKIALGALYKKRMLLVKDDGIYLQNK